MQPTHSPVRQRARQHMQLENDFTIVVYGVMFHVLLFITASLTLAVWTASAAAAASLGASSPPAPVPYPAASPAQASFASWPVCPRPPGDTHGETGRQTGRQDELISGTLFALPGGGAAGSGVRMLVPLQSCHQLHGTKSLETWSGSRCGGSNANVPTDGRRGRGSRTSIAQLQESHVYGYTTT